jgi:3-oxoadipate enol-lactonase
MTQAAKVDDALIHYAVRGSGYPLFLVHGLGGSLDGWDERFLSALDKHYRVVSLDNRGSGKTRVQGDEELSVPRMARDVLGLMENLGIDSAHMLGHSIGGMICQEIAISEPSAIEKLVLSSTSCHGLECVVPDDRELSYIGKGTPEEQACRYMARLFPDNWLEKHEERFRVVVREVLKAVEDDEDIPRQFMAGVEFDSCDRLQNIECPTLVACGTDDEVIPPANSRMLASRIPGARSMEYEGVGHALVSQVPEEFARDVIDFLG